MEATVQLVQTWWTKKSRGAPAAARRNAAPIAFVVPQAPRAFVHQVIMRQKDDFAPQATIVPGLPTANVVLSQDDDHLVMAMTPDKFGLPIRYRHPRKPRTVRLNPGEWVRWQINYRHRGYGLEWTYQFDTFNVAFGVVAADCFLGTPTRFVDEREHLF